MNSHFHGTALAEKHKVNRGLELAANNLYNKVSRRGILTALKRLFNSEKAFPLFTLNQVKNQIRVHGHEAVGEVTVDLDMILGTTSDGRAQDFDVDFRPLQEHNKERWLGVAAAWISGRRLGRVMLVQAGNIFFVEDGHHRISVAKAMGEQVIEADVVRLLGTGTLTMPSSVEETVAGRVGTLVPQPV